MGNAHWRHLSITIEPFTCGGDVAVCQITLTTCFFALKFTRSHTQSANLYRVPAVRFVSTCQVSLLVLRSTNALCLDGHVTAGRTRKCIHNVLKLHRIEFIRS